MSEVAPPAAASRLLQCSSGAGRGGEEKGGGEGVLGVICLSAQISSSDLRLLLIRKVNSAIIWSKIA